MEKQKLEISQYRSMLFTIAYNMLGSVPDAEDMVQESYASILEKDLSHVLDMKYYLIRTVSNKCITHLNKLKQQREAYKGTWLPDPLAASPEADDSTQLSIGFLYLLEKLSPLERGVLILKEAFDMDYAQICKNFDISPESCRQHLSRAKKKLSVEKTRFTADRQQHERTLHLFLEACSTRNPDKLIDLLREDVVVYADGGGNARAVLKPIYGLDKVVRLLLNGMEKTEPFARSAFSTINGSLSAIFFLREEAEVPDLIITIDADEDGKVSNIYFLANPDKLQFFTMQN